MSEFVGVEVNAGRVLRAIARIGYTPESAICDIVDNSVGAQASRIAIKLDREPGMAENRRNSAARYVVADDGEGMTRAQLVEALGLGVMGNYADGSLGKYGLGLKSAALSQGDRLDVVSSTGDGEWNKVSLDVQHVETTGRLECEVGLASSDEVATLQALVGETGAGTMVVIEKVHKRNHPSVKKTRAALQQVLGVTYFYFLEEGGGNLRIWLDDHSVAPFDPLFVHEASENEALDETAWDGRSVGWLERTKEIVLEAENGVRATLEITQLPHPPAFANPAEVRKSYMIGSQHYGFYVYRNRRLIRWAERFGGIVPTDQDYFAFRGRLLIDGTADDVLNVDVKKSELLLSEDAEEALSEAVYEARRKSRQAWKNANRLLKEVANEDPISKAAEALEDQVFPESLPSDPDDQRTETERHDREKREATRRPLRDEEKEDTTKRGERLYLVDQLDDNALWERAYDAAVGTIVRLNRAHRFTRLFYDRFGSGADVVLLFHSMMLSMAVAESQSIRNFQALDDEVLEDVFRRFRNQASSAIYSVTADTLEQRFA